MDKYCECILLKINIFFSFACCCCSLHVRKLYTGWYGGRQIAWHTQHSIYNTNTHHDYYGQNISDARAREREREEKNWNKNIIKWIDCVEIRLLFGFCICEIGIGSRMVWWERDVWLRSQQREHMTLRMRAWWLNCNNTHNTSAAQAFLVCVCGTNGRMIML